MKQRKDGDMQIKMTIDECLEFADEWSKGMTLHEGSQGWRVVCMLLADEVRKLRGDGDYKPIEESKC